jgi:hypothetical protein
MKRRRILFSLRIFQFRASNSDDEPGTIAVRCGGSEERTKLAEQRSAVHNKSAKARKKSHRPASVTAVFGPAGRTAQISER